MVEGTCVSFIIARERNGIFVGEKERNVKKIFVFIFLFMIAGILSADDNPTQNIYDAVRIYNDAAQQLQRANLRSQKKQIINNSISLSTEQAKAFWPIYDKYEAEFTKINDSRLAIISDYLNHYKDLTGEKAAELINRMMEVQRQRHEMKRNYVRELGKILPSKQALRLLLLESQMDLQVDAQIAMQIPLAD